MPNRYTPKQIVFMVETCFIFFGNSFSLLTQNKLFLSDFFSALYDFLGVDISAFTKYVKQHANDTCVNICAFRVA